MAHCLSVKTRLLKITSLFLIWNQTKDDLVIPKCRRRPMRWQHISCCQRLQWGFGTLAMGSDPPLAAPCSKVRTGPIVYNNSTASLNCSEFTSITPML